MKFSHIYGRPIKFYDPYVGRAGWVGNHERKAVYFDKYVEAVKRLLRRLSATRASQLRSKGGAATLDEVPVPQSYADRLRDNYGVVSMPPRHALSCTFAQRFGYYTPIPDPPYAWLEARAMCGNFVNKKIEESFSKMNDTRSPQIQAQEKELETLRDEKADLADELSETRVTLETIRAELEQVRSALSSKASLLSTSIAELQREKLAHDETKAARNRDFAALQREKLAHAQTRQTHYFASIYGGGAFR